ncbi:MAG TPA: hypothetical protein VMS22_03085 [Candidatus Eisenbacteria bacterium]|nr:hypothetical protein [Candidatus Eisenbacteria bacterium]
MARMSACGWFVGTLLLWGTFAYALPAAVDTDQDGYLDGLETLLGSDPADATKTPESVANPPACLDGIDNDGDGATDIDDPGCLVPPAVEDVFPPSGIDVFDSHMTLDGYDLATPFGVCTVDFDAHGPTVVRRGDPIDLGGGLRQIDTEMLAMELTGIATVVGGVGCALPTGDVMVTVFEDPMQTSVGKVTDTNPDPTKDFKADSFFDVFFDVDVGGTVLQGGPPGGPPGAPVHVTNQVASLPPYHSATNPDCYQVAGLAHEHCPKSPPDHFKCYTAKFPKFTKQQVTLLDQFGQRQAQVLKPRFLCTPSTKGNEPLYNETNHLTCYAVKPEKLKHTVTIHNQFGQGQVTTKKTSLLCLPTEKNGEGAAIEVDHFFCYTGKFPGGPAKRDVRMVDQFKTEENKAGRAIVLCNPVSKNGEGIRNPLDHLVCYALKPQREKRTVSISNQFGTADVKITKSAMLCTPTGKVDNETTTTTTTPVTTTTQPPGRALVPLAQIPGVPAGNICLSDVEPAPDGCVEPAHPSCPMVHLHYTILIHVGTMTVGPVVDTFLDPCGHGGITTDPDCGPDDIPDCVH